MTDRSDTPFDRLFAPHATARLMLLGRPPERVALPDLDLFERVACIAAEDEDMRVGTVRADPHHLPFHEALFDRVLLSAPLVQPRLMLRELWRVMAPAGLAVLVVKARRPWQLKSQGWLTEPLAMRLSEAMFEVLDWRVESLPERSHVVLLSKSDGLKPVMLGEAEPALVPAAVPAN